MLKTLWAEVKQGKIELLELADLPEGTRVLVTVLPSHETEQWLKKDNVSSGDIWDNIEDNAQIPILSE
jgi:hypothetical protein